MNVFILTTGRSGSMTFVKACQASIKNYTAGHETRRKLILDERLNFPDNHIECDGRLAFYLGQIDRKYGDGALYVHLRRNMGDTIRSCMPMYGFGTLKAWQRYIVISGDTPENVIKDFLQNRIWNIEYFLKDKTNVLDFRLENAHHDWPLFWDFIGAQGDYDAGLREWDIKYNSGEQRRVMYPNEKPPEDVGI